MSTQPMPVISAQKYLELEREAEFRSEFIAGQVFAMSGGTANHAWIVGRTLTELTNQLTGKPCAAAGNDLRVCIDRGEKFEFYRKLPSFTEYLLLRQDRMGAEHHHRQQDGWWVLREMSDPEAVIPLRSIGCSLSPGDLYDRVVFES